MVSSIGGSINGLLSNPSGIQQAISEVKGQGNVVTQVKEAAQKTVAAVNGAWIGGDADAYAIAIATKLVPAVIQLEMAIAGVSVNLSSGLDIMGSADQAVGKEGDALNSVFSKII